MRVQAVFGGTYVTYICANLYHYFLPLKILLHIKYFFCTSDRNFYSSWIWILQVTVLGLRFSHPPSLNLPFFELHKSIHCFSSYCSYTSFAPGVSFEMQQRAIRSGVHILVATPGRALDHISRGTIDLSNVKHVVLDEVRSSSLLWPLFLSF